MITSFNFLIFKFVRKLRSRRKHLKYSIKIIDKCFPVITKMKMSTVLLKELFSRSVLPVWPHDCSLSTLSLSLLELTSTESMMPSNPLIILCPLLFLPPPNLSHHQGVFQWVGSSHPVARVLILKDFCFSRTTLTIRNQVNSIFHAI